jgi:prevent-host-death family protein
MARTIAHRELRNNSSAILREVIAGEIITITNHGEPVAVLSPISEQPLPNVRMKRATIKGRFSEIESVRIDHPIQETLDYLRGDR